jgi:hypothetical protein
LRIYDLVMGMAWILTVFLALLVFIKIGGMLRLPYWLAFGIGFPLSLLLSGILWTSIISHLERSRSKRD